MSCSPFDLKDYVLAELTSPEQRQVEVHVKSCAGCRDEVDRLRVTQTALLSIPDEEIPQRIAFVSDQIFEPAPWRRFLANFWGSAARLGFASAAMLSAAIVVYALRPAPVVPVAHTPQQIVQTVSDQEIQARVDAAVAKVTAQIEARQELKTKAVMADLDSMRQKMMVAATVFDLYEKRDSVARLEHAGYRGPQEPEYK